MPIQFFLGANSPKGFYSFYDWLINLEIARDVLILKGGPGCGKSTFMRRVGTLVEEAGYTAEYIACASDPDSLDGVVFPELFSAIVDGTAPHVVEPHFPAAVERYLNLGAHYDLTPIKARREEIRRLTLAGHAPYERVARCLTAARALEDDIFNSVLDSAVLNTLARRARGIIGREIKTGSASVTKKRLLSAITPGGLICRFDTARALCPRIYELNDDYGLAHFMLAPILEAALAAKQEVYACYCPMNPENKLEHLLLPGLGLGFVSSSDLYPYDDKPFRRIRLNACLNQEQLRQARSRLRFLRKTERSLLDDAVEALAQAKALHDELEACYNPHMDFESVLATAEQTAAHLIHA